MAAFQRKNIRLPAAHYVGQRRYFLTLCTEQRRKFLLQHNLAEKIISRLRSLSKSHAFAVYAYTLMPDHFHALVIGLNTSSNLLRLVGNFKRQTTTEFHKSNSCALWQRKFYDYVLRDGDSTDAVAAYIWLNPVRKGLCLDAGEYPFSGSLVREWKPKLQLPHPWVPPWRAPKI